MIVIGSVVTDTAKMADFHLRVQPVATPGAWRLGRVLVQVFCNEPSCRARVRRDTVRAALQEGLVADYAQRCGRTRSCCVPAHWHRRERLVFEDLGIQQAPNSTVCSYLNKLPDLTGNFSRKGWPTLHSPPSQIGRTPAGAPIAGLTGQRGLEEILTEHPIGFAMIVERGNPPGRFSRLPGGIPGAGTDGGRCRHAPTAFAHYAAGGVAVREAGSHILQFRGFNTATAFSAAPRHCPNTARTRDLGAAGGHLA